MTAKTWAVRGWTEKFTTSELSRKVKFWRYVPIPTNLNGERFRILMSSGEGREAFGIFIALCELAANMPERGVLADERGPLTSRTIEIKTGIPRDAVEKAVSTLSDPDVGWLVEHVRMASGQIPEAVRPIPTHPNPTLPNPSAAVSHPANGVARVPIGSGGAGNGTGPEWTPLTLERFLRINGVNPKTASELAPHAAKLNGINLGAEVERIKKDPIRKDKAATLVGWIEKAAGIDRGSVGSIVGGMIGGAA